MCELEASNNTERSNKIETLVVVHQTKLYVTTLLNQIFLHFLFVHRNICGWDQLERLPNVPIFSGTA